MDHHDDWTHWPPDGPDPHDGDPFDHGPLGDHDPFGVEHDPLGGHDPFGVDQDPYGHDQPGGFDLPHDHDLSDAHQSTVDSYAAVGGDEPPEPGVDAHLFGVDHDLPPGDVDAAAVDFPPPLDLPDRPEPVDGYPWSDADALGDPGSGTAWPGPEPVDAAPPVADLLAYAGADPPGTGVDPWAALLDSDDPAVSALARWWGPVS